MWLWSLGVCKNFNFRRFWRFWRSVPILILLESKFWKFKIGTKVEIWITSKSKLEQSGFWFWFRFQKLQTWKPCIIGFIVNSKFEIPISSLLPHSPIIFQLLLILIPLPLFFLVPFASTSLSSSYLFNLSPTSLQEERQMLVKVGFKGEEDGIRASFAASQADTCWQCLLLSSCLLKPQLQHATTIPIPFHRRPSPTSFFHFHHPWRQAKCLQPHNLA